MSTVSLGSVGFAVGIGCFAFAAGAAADTHVLPAPGQYLLHTICQNGQAPSPYNAGCYCSDPRSPEAPSPPDDCLPRGSDGAFCLWSCKHASGNAPARPVTPAPAAHKASAPGCHDGAGHPARCFDSDDTCGAEDGGEWAHPPGGGCDDPPPPEQRVYRSAAPAPAPAPPPAVASKPSQQSATFVPPAKIGEVYIVVSYRGFEFRGTGHAAPTTLAVDWGGWQHHWVVPPTAGATHGFVLKLNHTAKDSVPLDVATDGVLLVGPVQGDPPPEWSSPDYQQIKW
jgi:hypothetical protein